MNNTNWVKSEIGYLSNHILVSYLGDDEPRYHVLENPDGDGWVIGVFYTFIGEYAPLEEEGEERLIFQTHEEAKEYVELELENE